MRTNVASIGTVCRHLRNVITLIIGAERALCIMTPAELIRLMDDDTVSLTGLTFVRHCPVRQCPVLQCPVLQFQRSRPSCRSNSLRVFLHQLSLLLYLVTQWEMKLYVTQ